MYAEWQERRVALAVVKHGPRVDASFVRPSRGTDRSWAVSSRCRCTLPLVVALELSIRVRSVSSASSAAPAADALRRASRSAPAAVVVAGSRCAPASARSGRPPSAGLRCQGRSWPPVSAQEALVTPAACGAPVRRPTWGCARRFASRRRRVLGRLIENPGGDRQTCLACVSQPHRALHRPYSCDEDGAPDHAGRH